MVVPRVVQEQPRERRTSIAEHPDNHAARDQRRSPPLFKLTDTEPRRSGFGHHARMVERQRPRDVEREFPAMLSELPPEGFAARQAHANAAVPAEIVRYLRHTAAREIVRRGHRYEARVAAEPHCDHVPRHRLTPPHTGVKAPSHRLFAQSHGACVGARLQSHRMCVGNGP